MRPVTNQQWQDAVNAAHAMLTLEMARLYGLASGGPEVNLELCIEFIEDGKQRGITPSIEAVPQLQRESSTALESIPEATLEEVEHADLRH